MLHSLSLRPLHMYQVLYDNLYMLLLYAVQVRLHLLPDLQSRQGVYDMLYSLFRRYDSGRQGLFHHPDDARSGCDILHIFRLSLHHRLRSYLLPLLL